MCCTGKNILNEVFDGVGHSDRGLKCIFGDLPMTTGTVLYPIGSDRARPALGDDPDVEGDDEPLASAIECDAPPWSNVSTYYHAANSEVSQDRCSPDDDRALCEIDEPKVVCVRVTLNDDPMQHTGDCVQYTYYDE